MSAQGEQARWRGWQQ